jgi:CubicO group peptidase (beta-lactamase class C family)
MAYERGYGLANAEHDLPIEPDTVFYAGSLSKQFTAFAVALLVSQGRIALDDDVRKHLPEMPAYERPITVRHLVHHTSGLRDYYALQSIAGRRSDEIFENRDVLEIAARQKGLNFLPGEQYLYSNTGYGLLALIVERASGLSLGAFADREMFQPLGMRDTHFGEDVTRLVKRRAGAYRRTNDGLAVDLFMNQRSGAGGLYTTVRDLLAWDENFYTGKVGGKAVIEMVETPGTLSGGRPMGYAFGLQVGTYRGQRIVEHGGSFGGYRAHLLRIPARHTSVALLCNMASIAPSRHARQVADVVLAQAFTEPPPPARSGGAGARGQGSGRRGGGPAAPALTAETIAALAGQYYSAELDATHEIF